MGISGLNTPTMSDGSVRTYDLLPGIPFRVPGLAGADTYDNADRLLDLTLTNQTLTQQRDHAMTQTEKLTTDLTRMTERVADCYTVQSPMASRGRNATRLRNGRPTDTTRSLTNTSLHRKPSKRKRNS